MSAKLPLRRAGACAALMLVSASNHASTGLAELGKMVFGMLWVLPGVLLLVSIVTLWLGMKMRLRWTVTGSKVALAVALCVFAYNGYLANASFPPTSNRSLEYLVYSSVLCLLSLAGGMVMLATQLMVMAFRHLHATAPQARKGWS